MGGDFHGLNLNHSGVVNRGERGACSPGVLARAGPGKPEDGGGAPRAAPGMANVFAWWIALSNHQPKTIARRPPRTARDCIADPVGSLHLCQQVGLQETAVEQAV